MKFDPCPKCGGPFVPYENIELRYCCATCNFDCLEKDLVFITENNILVDIKYDPHQKI